jgi:hypothetical protein
MKEYPTGLVMCARKKVCTHGGYNPSRPMAMMPPQRQRRCALFIFVTGFFPNTLSLSLLADNDSPNPGQSQEPASGTSI